MIKNNLKSIRHRHEMNQVEFAALLNISPFLYNRYEKQAQQPSLERALEIAEKLNMRVEDIFYREAPE